MQARTGRALAIGGVVAVALTLSAGPGWAAGGKWGVVLQQLRRRQRVEHRRRSAIQASSLAGQQHGLLTPARGFE